MRKIYTALVGVARLQAQPVTSGHWKRIKQRPNAENRGAAQVAHDPESGRRSAFLPFRRHLAESAAADDLVQETLIALHRRLMTYEPGRPFTAWLYAIARYKLIDHLRSSRRHRALPLDETPEVLFAVDRTAPQEDHDDVERILASLPERQRALVRAVKLEGQSIAYVSAATGLSPSAVKVTIHRAIKALSRRIAGVGR
ncbi:sigma-70 family RNA polymerase sigma factor (plasmid) [Nitrobacter sp. NHB1]|uniref:sigma-70 family RNA polymerase sigma factor n=1 Tax=Nitrobacter sp. NHB1 TaxID=3119830 RepID=UPI002FFE62DD